MTKEEKESLKQEIGSSMFRKIVIGAISMIIAAGTGSFIGVRTAQKVDREMIKNNKASIERIDNNVSKIQSDQLKQWKYIIENSNVRGDTVSYLQCD